MKSQNKAVYHCQKLLKKLINKAINSIVKIHVHPQVSEIEKLLGKENKEINSVNTHEVACVY